MTKGSWEVTNYYGYKSFKKDHLLSIGGKMVSINRGVYSIGLDGRNKKLLSNETGNNRASFSKNLNYFINTHFYYRSSSYFTRYILQKVKWKKLSKDNGDLKTKLADYKMSPKEFSTIKINGNDLNMWMIKTSRFLMRTKNILY